MIQELLYDENESIDNCKRWLENEKNHRDTQHYSDTRKSYLQHLNAAKELMLKAYPPDSDEETKKYKKFIQRCLKS